MTAVFSQQTRFSFPQARVYLLWRVDFTDPEYLPFREFLEKAKCNESHYSFSNKEVAEFSERVRIPKVFIANAADQKTLTF